MKKEEMQQNLPKKQYERSMNHNYMILCSYDFFEQEEEAEDYTEKMLLGNKIPGLLPVACRRNMGEKQYYYEINSMQSLDKLYEKKEIEYEELHKLLSGCVRVFERLEEYLLDGTQIILDPEYIYIKMETGEPFFVCYPEYHGNSRIAFTNFMDYLLTKVNHMQEQAVWLSYQVYRCTRNPNYVMNEIKELLIEVEETKEVSLQEKNDFAESEYTNQSMDSDNFVDNTQYDNHKESEYDFENSDMKSERKEKKPGNVLGVVLCMFLALSAGAIVMGARILKLINLSQKQEVSLYGAIGMSIIAAAIFFASLVNQWKSDKCEQETSKEEEEIEYWEKEKKVIQEFDKHGAEKQRVHNRETKYNDLEDRKKTLYTSELVGATVLLQEETKQERFLQGRVNGEDMKVSLKQLPLTIGKLAGFSDVIIPDNTVSRMHARLVQKNGQIYISDLNSTNGTMRNGDMIAINEEVALKPGDQIMLGRVCFTFC